MHITGAEHFYKLTVHRFQQPGTGTPVVRGILIAGVLSKPGRPVSLACALELAHLVTNSWAE